MTAELWLFNRATERPLPVSWDEVALAVDGDSGDFVEGDTRVIGVVNVPVGTVEVSDTDIACGGQPLVVVGIDFDFIQTVAGYWRVAGVVGVPAHAVEACKTEAEFQSVKLGITRVAAVQPKDIVVIDGYEADIIGGEL